jgi:hypothetical protein
MRPLWIRYLRLRARCLMRRSFALAAKARRLLDRADAG